MITYNSDRWLSIIFSWHGTVLPKIWIRIFLVELLTVMLALLQYFKIWDFKLVNPQLHSLLGTVVGLILVFRTNASYDRYWEGRKLWGSVITMSRNLERCISTNCTTNTKTLLPYIVSFAVFLRLRIRGESKLDEKALKVLEDQKELCAQLMEVHNPPQACLYTISAWVAERVKNGELNPALCNQIELYTGALSEAQAGIERIWKTPVPFAYAVFIRQMLTLFFLTLPFTMVQNYGPYSLVAVLVITFALCGIDEAGIEIENPFGTDANDLPIDEFCTTVEKDSQCVEVLFKSAKTARKRTHAPTPASLSLATISAKEGEEDDHNPLFDRM